jgi:hypothetical protein
MAGSGTYPPGGPSSGPRRATSGCQRPASHRTQGAVRGNRERLDRALGGDVVATRRLRSKPAPALEVDQEVDQLFGQSQRGTSRIGFSSASLFGHEFSCATWAPNSSTGPYRFLLIARRGGGPSPQVLIPRARPELIGPERLPPCPSEPTRPRLLLKRRPRVLVAPGAGSSRARRPPCPRSRPRGPCRWGSPSASMHWPPSQPGRAPARWRGRELWPVVRLVNLWWSESMVEPTRHNANRFALLRGGRMELDGSELRRARKRPRQ